MGYTTFGGVRPQGTRRKTPWGFENVGGVSQQQWDAGGGYNIPRVKAASMQALNEGAGSDAAERSAVGAFDAYDPTTAYNQFTAGSLAQTKSALADELKSLGDSEANQGRYQTGFYDEDRGEVARKVFGDHDARVANASLQVSGMQGQHLGQAADMATQLRNRYLGLVGDSYNRLYAEEQNKPRGGWLGNALGGVLGGVAGSVLGPVGSAVGAKLAKKFV